MDKSIGDLITEQINDRTKCIDMLNTYEILELINFEDNIVPAAVEKEINNIEKAVDAIVERIKEGGRLFYIGAGTSGRIGILDASECPPTFGTSSEMVQGIIAGGNDAILKAVEGVEDDEDLGRKIIQDRGINDKDVVLGITASGRTPFVIGAVKEAKKNGIKTIGLSNNVPSKISNEVDIAITPLVGPEVIMGSTRMKSGTAQKLVLNMITTATMIKLGKVYGNLMVDLQLSNLKLVDRAVRIIIHAADVSDKEALRYLEESAYCPKVAIVMIKTGAGKEISEKLLLEADGFVTKAINMYSDNLSR